MKKKILLLTLIILLVIPTIAFADSFKFETKLLDDDGLKVFKENDEVTINIKISDIKVGDLGMNTVEGILEYDEDIFEPVNTASFEGKNGWSFVYNEGATGQKGKFLGMVLSTGVKEEQEIAKLTLKVKGEVNKSAQSTDIVIKNIKTNNGMEFIEEDNKIVQVTLNITNSGFNPAIVIVIIVAIIAIILGLFSILTKKSK